MNEQKLPQHVNPVSEDRTAVAPYNFVPLPEKVVRAEEIAPEDRVPPKCDKQGNIIEEYAYSIRQDIYHPDRHTGRIECTLTTASPLYVRCGYTAEEYAELAEKPFDKLTDEEKRKRAQFFNLGDPNMPMIPGSSLRGMLRALVEIAGYGKMDRVTDQQHYFFRAVAAKTDDPLARPYRDLLKNVRAGYLVQRGQDWFIRPVQTIGTDTFIKVRESDIPRSIGLIRMNDPQYRPQYIEVSFTHKRTPNGRTVVDRVDKPGIYPNHGCLVTSGNMLETNRTGGRTNRKNHVVVLEPESGEIPIDSQAITDYRSGLTEFQKGPTDTKPVSERPFSEQIGMLADRRPVFYCEPLRGEQVRFFGHSPNFRVPYWRNDVKHAATPADLVPAKIGRGLEDKDQPPVTDIVEAMFGHVSRNSKVDPRKPTAGRVFVSDALLQADQGSVLYKEPLTPQILATPKPTTFQHYLVQTEADRVQTGTDRRGSPIYQLPLAHYQSKMPEETVVRGHKLYWHKGPNEQDATNPDIEMLPDDKKKPNESQRTAIRPVKPGVHFTFTIDFENLSNVELGALLWVLRLAADQQYRLKLGMGKPLGMGAVKIESKVVLSERKERYSTLFNGDSWAIAEQPSLTIDDVEAQQQCISSFERRVLQESGDPSSNGTLAGTLRMQCLLALLRWPGPTYEMTRYMEIERTQLPRLGNDPNEYKARRVLPTPLQVVGAPIPDRSEVPAGNQNPVRAAQSSAANAPSEDVIPSVGDIVTGNRSGPIRVPVRGVKVDINKKWYQVKPGTSVIGVIRTEDAGGQVSGGFKGEVVGRQDDKRIVYLFLKPSKSDKR